MTNREANTSDVPPGEAQVNELNQLAWNVRVTDSNLAFSLSTQAIDLAKQIQYQQGLAEGLRTLG